MRRLRCKHEWKTMAEKEYASPLSRVMQDPRLKNIEISGENMDGTYIHIMTCTKCGKINKTVIRI